MRSEWAPIDRLMRELGALRVEALALDPVQVGAAVMVEVEGAIGDAEAAVEATISGPEDAQLLLRACEAIVVAHARIAACRAEANRSAQAVALSVDLRRRAAELLYESIRLRQAP